MKKYYIAPELEVMDTTSEEQLLAGSYVSDESAYEDETALSPMFNGWGMETSE